MLGGAFELNVIGPHMLRPPMSGGRRGAREGLGGLGVIHELPVGRDDPELRRHQVPGLRPGGRPSGGFEGKPPP